MATTLAQTLNCLQPVSEFPPAAQRSPISTSGFRALTAGIDACGKCAACTRIARGVHPDVHVLEPGETGTIKIEQVRDVIDRAGYRPFEGKRRVVIIDGADGLVPAAQNALLKTLEEPPPSSIFVLLTTRPDMLLPTVRSRCIRLWFAEGSTPEVDAEARDVAHQVLSHAARTPDPRRRIEGAKDLLVNTGGSSAADRAQVGAYLTAMASLLRDVELLTASADPILLANPDARQALDQLKPAYQGSRGMRAFAAVDEALLALDRNAGVKTVADWLVLEL